MLRASLFGKASPLAHTDADADSKESQMVGLQEVESAQYQRIQRKRAKRATEFVHRPVTLKTLIISATMLAPIERVLPGPKLYSLIRFKQFG